MYRIIIRPSLSQKQTETELQISLYFQCNVANARSIPQVLCCHHLLLLFSTPTFLLIIIIVTRIVTQDIYIQMYHYYLILLLSVQYIRSRTLRIGSRCLLLCNNAMKMLTRRFLIKNITVNMITEHNININSI